MATGGLEHEPRLATFSGRPSASPSGKRSAPAAGAQAPLNASQFAAPPSSSSATIAGILAESTLSAPTGSTLLHALALAGVLALVRLAWNFANGRDLFLDSWVLVHVLEVAGGETPRLPRATLTLQYPLSYLPALPLAQLVGAFAAVKYAYPLFVSLAVAPAYLLTRRGPAPLLGALAMLALPDLAVKAMTGTPQAVALPLYLLALYFALSRRRLPFLLLATAILFTHHLTGMVTLVTYYSVWVLPHSREPGFWRREWPCLLFFGCWPLYWAWTFYLTDQSYIWPIFLTLTAVVGGASALLLYFAAPLLSRLLDATGERVAALSPAALLVVAGLAAAIGWLLSDAALESPGLASAAAANRAVVALYAALLLVTAAAVLARRHLGLALLAGTLAWLGFVVLPAGCHRVFDGLRLADYAILAGLVALLAPGLHARWTAQVAALAIACALLAGGIRLGFGHERLFAHTAGEYEAVHWLRANAAPYESVASDTKMSLLVLGEGRRNATFEGSWWLFDGSPLAPMLAALNAAPQFRERPIRYVLLADYMFERGADVGWFGSTAIAGRDLTRQLDALGTRAYEGGGATIWRLDAAATAGTAPPSPRRQGDLDVFLTRLFGVVPFVGRSGVCN